MYGTTYEVSSVASGWSPGDMRTSLIRKSKQLVPGAIGWAPLDAAVRVAQSAAHEPRALHGVAVNLIRQPGE